MSLADIVEASLKYEFQREKLGQPDYCDLSIVCNRLLSRYDIDVYDDPINPENLAKISEVVLDYLDEKLAYLLA